MRKLIDLNDGSQLETGVFPSLADNQDGLWETGSNFEFSERRAKKAQGFTVEATPGSTIYALSQAFASGSRRAYWAELSAIYMYQTGGVLRIGTGFTGTAGHWSLEPWGNFLLATNEEDPPQVWKDGLADSMAPLAGLTGVRSGRKYRIFKKHKNHVVAYYGQTAEWCSESDIELWVPAVNNSAGGEFIRDLDSDIVAACQLGPDVAIYSSDSLVLQRYVGAPFYFGFEKTIEGIGAVSEYSVLSVGNYNYGMSLKGFFKTDGVSYDYIDNPQVNRWFRDHFYPAQARRACAVYDEQNETVKWFFLGSAGQIYGLGFNLKKQNWEILDQMVTATADKQVFDCALIATRTSFGFLSGHDNGASAMECYLETFPLSAGQRENYKLWDVCYTNFEGSGLEIRFGFIDDPQAEVEWTEWTDCLRVNQIDREAGYLKVAFRSLGLGNDFALTGVSIHGEVTGYLDV